MLSLSRLNRFAMVAILPMMALVIVVFSRATPSSGKVTVPREGVLVIANLRGESFTIRDLAGGGPASTLGLAGAPHELAVVSGRLYATVEHGDSVVEVEPRAPAVLRSLALTGTPHGLAMAGGRLLVTRDDTGDLVTLDLGSFTELSRVSVGDTPHVVAWTPSGPAVAVSRENRLARPGTGVSGQTGELPEGIAMVGDYVVTADAGSRQLSVFRADTLEAIGVVALGGSPVRVVALDATHAVVSLGDVAEVAVVDVASRSVDRRIKVGEHPDGICLSPSGTYAAVASNAEDEAEVFQLPDWRLALTIQAGDGPGACAWLPSD